MVLFISVMAVSIYRKMDKVMVYNIAGVTENGLYENAEKIIYCLSGFISAIGTVMMPKISHMQKNGETEKVITRKIYPGYVFIKMVMTDESFRHLPFIFFLHSRRRNAGESP